jgi:hypothetical protein
MNREIFPTLPKRNNGELKGVLGNVKGIQIIYFEFKCHFTSPHRPFSLKLFSNRKVSLAFYSMQWHSNIWKIPNTFEIIVHP